MQKTLIPHFFLAFFLLSAILISLKPPAYSFPNSKTINQSEIISCRSNLFTGIWFKFLKKQREINQKITHHLNELKNEKKPFVFWIVLALAFLYGMIHAIGPGHGKLIVLSYFTAHEAKWKSGILMGFQIAFMHALSAVIVVLLVNNIAKHVFAGSPSKEMLIIKLISYGAITLMGFFMLWQARIRSKKQAFENEIEATDKDKKSQWLLSLSIGLIPCTGALLILFYAMAKQMLFIGIMIVFFMALGIAVTLSIIGVACILTKQNITRFTASKKQNKLISIFHYLGAGLITLIGLSAFIYNLKFAF